MAVVLRPFTKICKMTKSESHRPSQLDERTAMNHSDPGSISSPSKSECGYMEKLINVSAIN